MDTTESKKLAILRVLQILERYSDEAHPLTQQDIIRLLNQRHGISVDRKTIGRNMALLKEAGFDIVKTRSGSYLNARGFDDFELRVLTDGVLKSGNISARRTKDLIEKLCALSNSYFNSHTAHIVLEFEKKNNRAIFYNLGLIDSAIDKSRQIEYDLNKYGIDGKLRKISRQRVSPHQIALYGGCYYLLGTEEYWGEPVCHEIDHITNITVIDRPVSHTKSSLSVNSRNEAQDRSLKHSDSLFQKKQWFEFVADIELIDRLISRFGGEIKILTDDGSKKVRIKIKTTWDDAERLSLENISDLEIISPKSLRKRVKSALKEGVKKYK